MNKAIMIATKPEWVEKIINGEKDFEFRNYKIPSGTKVYVYETLGKFSQKIIPISKTNPIPRYAPSYEGKGKIVLEFVIGEVYGHEKENAYRLLDSNGYSPRVRFSKIIGCKGQKFAHKITKLKVYDEPISYTNFVGWNKLNNDTEGVIYYPYVTNYNQLNISKEELIYYTLKSHPQGPVWVVEL